MGERGVIGNFTTDPNGGAAEAQRLLTVSEIARVLHVSPSWIYQRTRLGNVGIPHIKVGKYVRFDLPEVLAFLRSNGGSLEE